MHRILVVTSTFPARVGDGVPAFVLDIAREQAREFEVIVLAPSTPGSATRERIDGVEVVRFRYAPRRWETLAEGAILDNLAAQPLLWLLVPALLVAEAVAIRRIVRRERIAAIHAHWAIPQGMLARLVAPRVPLLVTTHGGDLYALNRGFVGVVKRAVVRSAERVTTVNSDMRRRLLEWGVAPARVSVLPMGVPLDEAARATAVGAARRIDGVVAIGRLVEKKGMNVLIDAVKRHLRVGEVAVTIIGDGPLRGQLERQAHGWRVDFAGQQPRSKVLESLSANAIFVLPSVTAASGDREGLPVTLLEAAAMGCAIVASALPGIDEAVRDETEALLVAPGDPAALASAIRRLIEDPELRTQLGRAAADRSTSFSTMRVGAEYSRIMSELIVTSARR